MRLEDRLQGEWLCCVDDQCLEDAWSIDIRGRQCDFEGTIGMLSICDNEAALDLGGGDRLVINREWSADAPNIKNHDGEIPIIIESGRGVLHLGWMFRVAAFFEAPGRQGELDADN